MRSDDFISKEGGSTEGGHVGKEGWMKRMEGGGERERDTWQAERNTLTPRHARPRDSGTSQLVCVS